MWSLRRPGWSPAKCACAIWYGPSRCRSTSRRTSISTAATIPNACARPLWPSTSRACGHVSSKGGADGRRIGVGVSIYCEQAAHGTSVLIRLGQSDGPGHEQASVRLTADGDLEIRVGMHSHGQGKETTSRAGRARNAGRRCRQGRRPRRHGYHAIFDRHLGLALMVMAGGAVAPCLAAAGERARRIGAVAAADRVAMVLRTARSAASTAASPCRKSPAPGISGRRICLLMWTPGGLDVTSGYKPSVTPGPSVMPPTPRLLRSTLRSARSKSCDYVIVEDGGVLVNPMVVDGQIYGGIAQGIGTALYEAMPFDAYGQPLASTLRTTAAGPTEVPIAAYSITWRRHRLTPSSASRASAKVARSAAGRDR